MKYGTILALLLVAIGLGWIATNVQQLEEDSYATLMVEYLAEQQVETVASSDGTTTVVGSAPTEEQLDALKESTDGWDFLSGPFNYVNLILGAFAAAGAAIIIQTRLQGSGS